MKHGRISFLTDRGPILCTSPAVVFVFVVSVVPSMVATTIPRGVGRDRGMLSRGGRGRKVEIQELVCALLLLTANATLLFLTMFRVTAHTEFQNLLTLTIFFVLLFLLITVPYRDHRVG